MVRIAACRSATRDVMSQPFRAPRRAQNVTFLSRDGCGGKLEANTALLGQFLAPSANLAGSKHPSRHRVEHLQERWIAALRRSHDGEFQRPIGADRAGLV